MNGSNQRVLLLVLLFCTGSVLNHTMKKAQSGYSLFFLVYHEQTMCLQLQV